MLYKVGTRKELTTYPCRLPCQVYSEIFVGLVVLDCEYGSDRNYYESGGYSIILENSDDVSELTKIIDINTHLCEWTTAIGNTGYLSSLYVMNDDFSIIVYMPKNIAPTAILNELED